MADFQKVLSLYPNFASKAQAEQLMGEIRQQVRRSSGLGERKVEGRSHATGPRHLRGSL